MGTGTGYTEKPQGCLSHSLCIVECLISQQTSIGVTIRHTSYCHVSDVQILKRLSALLCSLFCMFLTSFVFAFFSLLCSLLIQPSQPAVSASYWYVFCSFMFAFLYVFYSFLFALSSLLCSLLSQPFQPSIPAIHPSHLSQPSQSAISASYWYLLDLLLCMFFLICVCFFLCSVLSQPLVCFFLFYVHFFVCFLLILFTFFSLLCSLLSQPSQPAIGIFFACFFVYFYSFF